VNFDCKRRMESFCFVSLESACMAKRLPACKVNFLKRCGRSVRTYGMRHKFTLQKEGELK
jgi:hypothetical protein